MLLLTDSILLFVNVQEISFSSKSQLKSMCKTIKELIVELDMNLKILMNIYFVGMKKLFNGQREN